MTKSVMSSLKEYGLKNKKSIANFACTFSTFFATNLFVDESITTLSGVATSTGLSAWKDTIYLGGSLPETTRVIFVTKDVLASLPSVSFPGLCFLYRTALVF